MRNRKIIIYKLIFIILIFTQFFACKQENKIKKNKETKVTNEFQINLQNKPKLFLKYWENMSNEQFLKVSELLINEKTIKKIDFEPFIDVKENYFELVTSGFLNPIIIPNFVNNKLISIKLYFQSHKTFDSFYELYKKKYHLRNLDSICTLTNVYIEKNPDYKYYKTEKEKETDEFNEVEEDNSDFVIGKIQLNKNKYSKDYYPKIIPENFKTKKNNIVIDFNQFKITKKIDYTTGEIFGGKHFTTYKYSLDFNNKFITDSGVFVSKEKSKNRVVLEYYILEYEITYKSEKMIQDDKLFNLKQYEKYKIETQKEKQKQLEKTKNLKKKNLESI